MLRHSGRLGKTISTVNVILVGYMASGKTTLGRALARRTGMQFIDLDFYITQRFRRSVAELFAERGEEGFRRLEASMLREVCEFDNAVISCGGGTPCFCGNMDYMLSRGVTVWLEASEDVTVRRIREAHKERPLMAGKDDAAIRETMRGHMEVRRPFYSRARLHCSGDMLESVAEISSTVEELRARLPL